MFSLSENARQRFCQGFKSLHASPDAAVDSQVAAPELSVESSKNGRMHRVLAKVLRPLVRDNFVWFCCCFCPVEFV